MSEEDYDYEFEMDFEANHGDLVEVDEYPGYWFVEYFRVEHHFYYDVTIPEVIYELTNALPGVYTKTEYIEVDMDVLTFVTDPGQADEFLRENSREIAKVTKTEEETKMAKEPKKLTQRELSSQEAARRKQVRKDQAEKVDALLDDYNDAKALAEMFPEDNSYKEKVEYLTVKLAEASVEK